MSFFKRKSKAKKGQEQEEKPAAEPVADAKPTPVPYKHVPKHAAADAAIKPTEKASAARVAAANQQWMSSAAKDYSLGSAADRQSIAHNAMHSTPSPSSAAGQQRQYKGTYGIHKNNSAEVFVTDPDAPPLPVTPLQHQQNGNTISRSGTPGGNTISRSGTPKAQSSYFSQQANLSPSFDPQMLGNPKMQNAARDRGYMSTHDSADSGYGSVAHSRAPSEQFNPTEVNGVHLPRTNSGFLPELSLSEELSRDPAFSEHSFAGDEVPEPSSKKAPESVLKNGKGYLERQASQLDYDSRSVYSTKSSKAPKQTRFEQAPEIVDYEPQRQQEWEDPQTLAQEYAYLTESEHVERPESATLPRPQFNVPTRTSTPPPATYEEHTQSFAAPVRYSTPAPQTHPEPQPQYTLPARTSSPPPVRERDAAPQMSSAVRYSSPPPQSNYTPLERMLSMSQQSMVSNSPVSKLEGYKVNKRGKILNEEGDPIGELCEGDIMDCVRQRVNAYGEVLDDNGVIVGRVRSLGWPQESPILRIASPAPYSQQQQQYFPQFQQGRPQSPALSRHRGESAASQEVFTPAWQQQHVHNRQPSLALELQQHLANAASHDSPRSVVRPIDLPTYAPVVELPATETEQVPEEEVLPIFDHSDVFVPVPMVPARSPRRPETPSPPIEKQQRWPVNEQALQQRPSSRASQEMSRLQSKHVSAPVPQRQQYEPPAQEWAAAAAIETLPEEQPLQTCAPPPLQQRQSTSDLAKSYSRPSMSTVPEDDQLATNVERSPALFSYKGEIPATDGPALSSTLAPPRALGVKSPPPANPPRQVSYSSPQASQFSYAGTNTQRGLAPPRQFTTGVPGPRPILNTRYSSISSGTAPLRRSPLSSHEITPPDSDQGSYEDGEKVNVAHGRPPSIRTLASMQSMAANNKPRAYFTHSGKVGVDASPAQAAAKAAAVNTTQATKSASPSISDKSAGANKKKSRFSMGFGKKAVAAH